MTMRDVVIDTLPKPARRGLAWARQSALYRLRSFRRPEVVTHHGVQLRIGPHVSDCIREFIYRGTYEGGELKPLRKYLTPGDRVFEIGAGIGFISLFCAKIVGAANVFSYEANPANRDLIHHNFQLNNLFPQLTIGFLDDAAGKTVSFFIHDDFWNSSIHPQENSRAVEVPTISLSEELQRVRPTCLVVDIEGGEYELFRRMAFNGIEKVVVELHPYLIGEAKTNAVLSMISDAGFRPLWCCDDKLHWYYARHVGDQ